MNKRKRRWLLLPIFFLLIAFFLIICAPRFLLYSSDCENSDAIILLLGPDFTARQKEAYRLINEGKADFLIIPAYHKVYRVLSDGQLKFLSPTKFRSEAKNKSTVIDVTPGYFEDTHIEIIEAKEMMSHQRLNSAIFISSPYHMRRIKVIAAKVFDLSQGKYYFVPTSFEKAPANFWVLSWPEWKKVGREYGKIIWFKIYHPWINGN